MSGRVLLDIRLTYPKGYKMSEYVPLHLLLLLVTMRCCVSWPCLEATLRFAKRPSPQIPKSFERLECVICTCRDHEDVITPAEAATTFHA
jgi:hypothetical protein